MGVKGKISSVPVLPSMLTVMKLGSGLRVDELFVQEKRTKSIVEPKGQRRLENGIDSTVFDADLIFIVG